MKCARAEREPTHNTSRHTNHPPFPSPISSLNRTWRKGHLPQNSRLPQPSSCTPQTWPLSQVVFLVQGCGLTGIGWQSAAVPVETHS